jgi:O-antigen ligase
MWVHGAAAVVAALFLASSMFSGTVAARLLLLGTGLALTGIVAFRPGKDVRLLPAVWLPFLLWGAWALLSLAWSFEPDRTWKEWRNEIFYTGAALWVCYVGAQAQNAPRLFLTIVSAAAMLVCGVALYEFSGSWEGYMVGWHGGPGDHSSALLTLMPCVAMAAWYFSRQGRPLWPAALLWVLVAIFFASAYTTLNRTIWGALAIEFALIGFLVLARARARVAAIVVTLIVAAGCAAMVLNIQAQREALGGTSMQGDHRLELWPQILERIEERPLTGYGFGRGILREGLQKEFSTLDTHLWHAHNIFLEALIQGGAPAVLLLLFLLGALAREGWRLARDADEAVAACGIALLAVLAGMLARNMTDMLLVRQNALLFWGVSGALLAMGRRSGRLNN